jgi:hypothetical protein
MKKYICLGLVAALFAACEKKETNVTNPTEKKESSSTTIVNPSPAKSPSPRISAAPFSRALHVVAFEQQHPLRTAGGRMRFLKNRAKTDIIKRDCEFMLLGEARYLLLTLAQTHASGPNPCELRIVDCADLLLLQLGFYQIG